MSGGRHRRRPWARTEERRYRPDSEHQTRLIFEPLEPRLLLNADLLAVDLTAAAPDRQDHDLLVRMVEETQTVDQQSVTVQRVEVVDRNDADAVIATGDLSAIGAVSIASGTGSEVLTIDIDSFGDLAAPVISYFAGDAAGTDSLVLQTSDAAVWRLDAAGGGTIGGPDFTIDFAGVEALFGGVGQDTLVGSAGHTDWLIDGAGAGNVSGLTFSGFENLTGAADNEDVFTLADGGGLSGAVDGGAGGFDSLVLAGGPYNTVDYQATDAHSGTIVVDGAIIAYAGLEPLTQTGTAANVVLSGSALLDVLTLGSDPTNDGNLLFAGPTIEIVSFPHPTESLTIRLGAGDDILTILDFDGGLGALLNVQGEDGYDSLLVFGTISTRAAAGGGAGDVDVVVENIALRPGAEILADASGSIDGNVSLVAAATGLPTGLLPGAVAVLDVDDATIRGGNVTLSASAAIAVDAASPGIAAVGAISAAIVTIGGPSPDQRQRRYRRVGHVRPSDYGPGNSRYRWRRPGGQRDVDRRQRRDCAGSRRCQPGCRWLGLDRCDEQYGRHHDRGWERRGLRVPCWRKRWSS